jgi:excisionase family DNA binding protein
VNVLVGFLLMVPSVIMALVMDKALSVDEASRALGCSKGSLLRPWWRKRHSIPAVRVGRRLVFLENDLRAWLEARREPWGSKIDVEPDVVVQP